jgi:protein transport protein HofQ
VEAPAFLGPPEVQLETIVLKFLDAKTLKGALDKMVTPYGAVAVNEKTNSVVVCDTAESLPRILQEIRKADRTPRQVMVEVVILDVQLKNDSEIGVNWDFLSTDLDDVSYRQSLTGPRVLAIPPTAETVGSAAAYNSVGLGGDFSVIAGSVRTILHMIQEKRNVEILASPRALVVSGQSATIKAVEEIPYKEVSDTAQGGQAALTSTKFKEVGVSLQVIATVADGNNILLDIRTQQSVRTGESATGVPVVDSRQADTSLLLRDGQTAIIGGLRREEKTKQVNQVPLLGDLPLIGALFRNVSTVTGHSELVVLLNPHIYVGDAVPGEVTARVDAIRSRSPLKTQVIAGSAPGKAPQTGVGQEP